MSCIHVFKPGRGSRIFAMQSFKRETLASESVPLGSSGPAAEARVSEARKSTNSEYLMRPVPSASAAFTSLSMSRSEKLGFNFFRTSCKVSTGIMPDCFWSQSWNVFLSCSTRSAIWGARASDPQ